MTGSATASAARTVPAGEFKTTCLRLIDDIDGESAIPADDWDMLTDRGTIYRPDA